MKDILLVFLGGGLGSIIRFSLAKWVTSLHAQNFPWGTLAVNVIACFVLGLVIGFADQKQIISPSSRLFWMVGFCGGFSTFSTFSNETLVLIQSGLTLSALAYVALSVVLCVLAVVAGLTVSQTLL